MASPDWPIDEAPGRDVRAPIPETFRLESGERLAATAVDGRLYGPPEGPLVVVAGGISADRRAARWWSWAVRRGGAVDLDRVRVLAFDWPPGDEDGAVTITTADQARLLALLLDGLGEPRIDAFVGASYGGCVGLAFAAAFPADRKPDGHIGTQPGASGCHRLARGANARCWLRGPRASRQI